jgi:hypothetical protein
VVAMVDLDRACYHEIMPSDDDHNRHGLAMKLRQILAFLANINYAFVYRDFKIRQSTSGSSE